MQLLNQRNSRTLARARWALDARFRDNSVRELQISQSAVTQLELSEVAGTARLDSLRRAAAALDCNLVYALVPKRGLDRTMHDRAVELATRDLAAESATPTRKCSRGASTTSRPGSSMADNCGTSERRTDSAINYRC